LRETMIQGLNAAPGCDGDHTPPLLFLSMLPRARGRIS
jgi:hypothetical protein